MAILRYSASADNTITNAFEPNLTTRGTGSNMGQADILEVFSIYGQASSTSVELERALLQFPISTISADRDSGIVPKSGSVNFFLKMTNAPHAGKTPRDYQLLVSAVSQSWQEGIGLDMENYTDLTYNGIGSNWMNASGVDIPEISKITCTSGEKKHYSALSGVNSRYIVLYNSDDKYNLWFFSGSATDGPVWGEPPGPDEPPTQSGTNIKIWIAAVGVNDSGDIAYRLAEGINASSSMTANRYGSDVYVTASLGGVPSASVSLYAGETYDLTGPTVSVSRSGSWATVWTNEGGDYYTDASSSFTASFDTGLENLEVDITTLVEQWIDSAGNVLGSKDNYGVGVHLNAAYEGSSSSNPTGAKTSYYTKKFFARHSEFFFKRPYIEARWNSAIQDDRGAFYFSSSLAPANDNLNTIYLYNYVRGRLVNIPTIDTGNIYVQLYSGSLANTAPSGGALTLVADGTHVNSHSPTYVTGGYVSTGIYSASFALTGAASSLTRIFDVWLSGSTQYTTGSIETNSINAKGYTTSKRYVVTIPNLQDEYYKNETARLRLYVREKGWSPNIYTKATSVIPATLIPSASYRVNRVADGYEVVSYGTGSLTSTGLSYDVSGNYFDLSMKLFEPGYQYALKFAFKDENTSTYYEQPYIFKFRVAE